MENIVTRTLHKWVAIIALLAFPSVLLAHRLDEYLQATLVTIERDHIRLQINLTPGVAVAEQILNQIDSNHDGFISNSEAEAYSMLVKHDLVVQLDQRDATPELTAFDFPSLAELRTGFGIIQMEFSITPSRSLNAGEHKLIVHNLHLPAISVYLVNAAQPSSDLIQITTQRRSNTQSMGEIGFAFHESTTTAAANPTFPKLIGLIVSFASLLVAGVVIKTKRQAQKRLISVV